MQNSNFPLDSKSESRLSTKGLPLENLKAQIDDSLDFTLELWRSQGLNIIRHKGYYYYATKFTPINKAEFCVVDIETNGSKLDKHQIIEIAAIKFKDNKIIGKFDSLVQCDRINPHITEITGISVKDTKDAPPLKDVLEEFKLFLGDAIFVAHDVKFDYNFISGSLQKIGLLPLLNRPLCSLSLAERTLVSYRYALSYLNKTFHLHPEASHHRAMCDVLTTYELVKLSMQNIEENLNNVEDLIKFSKTAPKKKRPKIDPFLVKAEEEKESSE